MADAPRYPRPNTDPEYRVDAQECMDRAQRALEVAEINLDKVSELFNTQGKTMSFADLIAHGEARTRLGQAWRAMATTQVWGTDG